MTACKSAPWHTVDGKHYGVPYMWGPNVLMYNTEVFKEPPTSWNVVFEEMTLPDGKSNKGRVQAYDGPIHVADAANYLMKHKPELGIKSPYELNADQYKPPRSTCCGDSASWSRATGMTPSSRSTTSPTKAWSPPASWPFQVNLLRGKEQPIASRDPERGCDRLGRHHHDAHRRGEPELRLHVDGAHPVLQPA